MQHYNHRPFESSIYSCYKLGFYLGRRGLLAWPAGLKSTENNRFLKNQELLFIKVLYAQLCDVFSCWPFAFYNNNSRLAKVDAFRSHKVEILLKIMAGDDETTPGDELCDDLRKPPLKKMKIEGVEIADANVDTSFIEFLDNVISRLING